MPQYPIRAAARLTGLSIDTLRAWERRYAAVTPERGERGRVYTDAHISRLRQLAALVGAGHSIGAIARLPEAALTDLLAASGAPPNAARSGPDLERMVDALQSGDLLEVETTLTQFAAVLPPRDLVLTVVIPALQMVGTRWVTGALLPWQEHLVSASMRSVLGSLVRMLSRPTGGARALFATPSGERHEMGLLCAALLAAARGASVVYLGPDLPADDIVAAATALDAESVVLSVTSPTIPADVATLSALSPHVAVWVGGAGGAELTARLGARAQYVSDLDHFERLLRT